MQSCWLRDCLFLKFLQGKLYIDSGPLMMEVDGFVPVGFMKNSIVFDGVPGQLLLVPLPESHPNPKWGKLSKKSQSSKFFQGKISHSPVRVVTHHTTTGLPSFHRDDSLSFVDRHQHFVYKVSLAQFQPSLAKSVVHGLLPLQSLFDDTRKPCFILSQFCLRFQAAEVVLWCSFVSFLISLVFNALSLNSIVFFRCKFALWFFT